VAQKRAHAEHGGRPCSGYPPAPFTCGFLEDAITKSLVDILYRIAYSSIVFVNLSFVNYVSLIFLFPSKPVNYAFGRRSVFSLVQKHPKSEKSQNRKIEKMGKPTHLRTYRSSTENR